MKIANTLVAAAAAGMLFGAGACSKTSDTSGAPAASSTTANTMPGAAIKAKHDCQGKNDCKGQGGCKTSKNGCAGKNDCKGQGGCKTS